MDGAAETFGMVVTVDLLITDVAAVAAACAVLADAPVAAKMAGHLQSR